MMRLSGTAGSRPCSTRRCFWIPLISIWTVPSPTATGSASDPPCLTRRSSIARSAVRAGAPDVVGAGLEAVELLDDGERYHQRRLTEARQTVRIGDQHRCVDDHPGAGRSPDACALDLVARGVVREKVGHGHL